MISTAAMRNASALKLASGHHRYHLRRQRAMYGYGRLGGVEVMSKYVRRRKLADIQAAAAEVVAVPPKRLCADCQTSATPLWRSGPGGPKSLCNACGIRYRRKRSRAAASAAAAARLGGSKPIVSAAAGVAASAAEAKAEQLRRLQREKQERLLLLVMQGKQERGTWQRRGGPGRICGPGDEETEAALLLMSLSSSAILVRS